MSDTEPPQGQTTSEGQFYGNARKVWESPPELLDLSVLQLPIPADLRATLGIAVEERPKLTAQESHPGCERLDVIFNTHFLNRNPHPYNAVTGANKILEIRDQHDLQHPNGEAIQCSDDVFRDIALVLFGRKPDLYWVYFSDETVMQIIKILNGSKDGSPRTRKRSYILSRLKDKLESK